MKKGAGTVQERVVKAVLFDLDGVLVDSIGVWYSVFNYTLRYFGIKPLTRREFAKDFGSPIEHDIKRYFNGKTVEEIEQIYNRQFEKRKNLVKLSPESIEVLEKLKRKKVKLGLISNSTRFIVLATLNQFKLKKYFSAIVSMDDVKRRKPAPDMVIKACKILKTKPKNTMLVGDSKNDIFAGKRAGCITVGYKIKGDFRVNQLKGVLKLLE